MDIYTYLRSPDVAAFCWKIGKTWNTYEMAAIIGKSDRTMAEKHAAWQELIGHCPDMSVELHDRFNSGLHIESVHKKLAEIMGYELQTSKPPDMPEPIDNLDWNWCFVDIPVPFKRGDILVLSYIGEDTLPDERFVLDKLDRDNEEQFLKNINSKNYISEAWGLFVNEVGALYGDHVGDGYENCVYYKGKLEGKDRLLHYVSLFVRGEIGLPELLNMQCRVVAEHLLTNNFHIDPHGCYIPEYLLTENRLTP